MRRPRLPISLPLPRLSLPSLVPRSHQKPGTAPGTLSAAPGASAPALTLFTFSADQLDEFRVTSWDHLAADVERFSERTLWLNVDGLGDIATIGAIGKHFGLHPLALEDVTTPQRPKLDDYPNHLFIVLRMVRQARPLDFEQLTLFLGDHFVITFQEEGGDCLESVRHRLRTANSRVRSSGPDYLAYAIIDAVVDHYFPLFENLGERVESFEDILVANEGNAQPGEMYSLRHELWLLRRVLWPMRDLLNRIVRNEDLGFFGSSTRLYLRDCHDHALHLIDIHESLRELVTGLIETSHSMLSARTNDIMRVLTVIAVIFMPLTFIAGVYGMNFSPASSPYNMPELSWRWGYPFALGLMLLTAGALVGLFRRKGWLRSVVGKGQAARSSSGSDGSRAPRK